MDALSIGLRRELIRRVYPDLRYGGDPDIDRYFEHRRNGRLGDALGLYNGPLRARYPDDQNRITLLRLYRENDPRWVDLQDRLVLQLAGKIAATLARNIDTIASPLLSARLSNAFRALSAVESILRILPDKDEASLVLLERYVGLARLLGHRAAEMEKARDLVREYLAMARADSPSEYDFIARSKEIERKKREAAQRLGANRSQAVPGEGRSVDFIARSEALERRRRREEEARVRWFDLSKIQFSPVDRARVEIPERLTRREDKVLAFCWKYWTLVADPGFERLVFIYSKKFGTRHYAIFKAIKVGRSLRSTDDEVLTAVSGILSTDYSYSVSGDLYMQSNWRRLKAAAEAERAAAAGAALPVDRQEVMRKNSHESSAAEARRKLLRETAPSAPASAQGEGQGDALGRRKALPTAPKPRTELRRVSPQSRKAKGADLGTRRPPASPVAKLTARTGSVSDRIRKLSGKAYDVYRQLFLERVRADIHRILVGSRTKAFRLFDESANEAEDIVFAFMSAHYADPFMNWEGSDDRARVEALGFALPTLDGIIESWYRRL